MRFYGKETIDKQAWFQTVFQEQRVHMTMSAGTALTDLNINDSKRKTMSKTKRANVYNACYYDMKIKLQNSKSPENCALEVGTT